MASVTLQSGSTKDTQAQKNVETCTENERCRAEALAPRLYTDLPKLDTQGAANVTHEGSKAPLLCFQSALRRPKALDVENQVWLL